jgi:hypothetical protein
LIKYFTLSTFKLFTRVLGENRFEFRREKGGRDAFAMLRIILNEIWK